MKGVLLLLAGSVVFIPMLLPAVFAPNAVANPEHVRRVGQAFLLFYCVLGLMTSSTGERAIAFTPAETALLFPAPFRQRQLLAYKVVFLAIVSVLSVPFLAVACRPYSSGLFAGTVGLALAILFLQFFAMAVGLAAETAGVMAHNRRRKIVAVGLLVVLALAAGPLIREISHLRALELLTRVEQSWAARALMAPFRPYVEVFTAARVWPDIIGWAAVGLAIDLTLVAVIFALDAQYMDASARASAKIYAVVERARRSGGVGLLASGRPARFSLPMFPGWGGAGPIAWRQFSTARREIARMIVLLVIFTPTFFPLIFSRNDQKAGAIATGMQSSILGLTMFLTALVPFDFRADLDRMAELKVLPVRPLFLVIGQLVAPVALITFIQWLCLIVLAAGFHGNLSLLIIFLLFSFPANVLVVGVDNLLFLLFPMRAGGSAGLDFQALGRAMAAMFGKLVFVGLPALFAVAVGAVVLLLTGHNWPAALVAAWIVVTASALALLWVIAWAFERFDVARDVPI